VLEQVEEILFTADIGVKTSTKLLDIVKQNLKGDDASQVREKVSEAILDILHKVQTPTIHKNGHAGPLVVMFVGVNGVGKTTTIGKLAAQFSAGGSKVILGAGDTFRAAAGEQLEVWASRSGAEIVRGAEQADPSSVLFDAVNKAKSENADYVLCDTAGRLHTKINLMEELKKVHRVLGKASDGAPQEVLLVVDATTGQNAIEQARQFKAAAPLTGVILTKLDGTAKGGVVIGIADELGIPIRYIGVGESASDLRPFDADEFVKALFSEE
jgi:fused signal recognition particle receptor